VPLLPPYTPEYQRFMNLVRSTLKHTVMEFKTEKENVSSLSFNWARPSFKFAWHRQAHFFPFTNVCLLPIRVDFLLCKWKLKTALKQFSTPLSGTVEFGIEVISEQIYRSSRTFSSEQKKLLDSYWRQFRLLMENKQSLFIFLFLNHYHDLFWLPIVPLVMFYCVNSVRPCVLTPCYGLKLD
jgi:hypothetical protein